MSQFTEWIALQWTILVKTHRFGNDTISSSLLKALWEDKTLEKQNRIPLEIRKIRLDDNFENQPENDTINFLKELITKNLKVKDSEKFHNWIVLHVSEIFRPELIHSDIYKDPNNKDGSIAIWKIRKNDKIVFWKEDIWTSNNLEKTIKTCLSHVLKNENDIVTIEEAQENQFVISKITFKPSI
ncbi:MAG: hypothetical protein ACD_80C00146G0017 [uncultured bacterium (gcode 4)]|uniref:Uncharacterized protein n=1 Tax=uncultured bacterium (gcode 4) TaxID=1234023 RepID=K1XI89_9BACT|nr:MAG: hypothetical protein ACD_80C00146G0017 [uncultured bacterium (gcode 4)]